MSTPRMDGASFGSTCSSVKRKQFSTRREGSEQTNAFCLFLKKFAAEGVYPSENIINSFLVTNLNVDVKKLYSVSHWKVKKCVVLSFIEEKDLFALENKVYRGVQFPGSGQNVTGYRLDRLNITARLIGAPPWVEQSDVNYLFEWWGKVMSSKRETSILSSSSGTEGVWGSGWVWDSESVVKVQRREVITIPTCISACGDVVGEI